MKTFALFVLPFLLLSCSKTNTLNISLRCDDNAKGQLEVYYQDLAKKSFVKNHSLDIKTICQHKNLELSISEYKHDSKIKFIKILEDGTKYELISNYGTDIHRDKKGSWVVLKIINNEPYIKNDAL